MITLLLPLCDADPLSKLLEPNYHIDKINQIDLFQRRTSADYVIQGEVRPYNEVSSLWPS